MAQSSDNAAPRIKRRVDHMQKIARQYRILLYQIPELYEQDILFGQEAICRFKIWGERRHPQ